MLQALMHVSVNGPNIGESECEPLIKTAAKK